MAALRFATFLHSLQKGYTPPAEFSFSSHENITRQ